MGEGQVVLVHKHKGMLYSASIQVLIFFRVQPVVWFPWLVYELFVGPCLLGSGCSSWDILLGGFRLAVLRLRWAGRWGLQPVRALRRLCSLCMPAAMLLAISTSLKSGRTPAMALSSRLDAFSYCAALKAGKLHSDQPHALTIPDLGCLLSALCQSRLVTKET